MDKSKTPRWEVVVHVHSISLIMEKLPPVGYKSLGAGPDLGTVSSFDQQCFDTTKLTALHGRQSSCALESMHVQLSLLDSHYLACMP